MLVDPIEVFLEFNKLLNDSADLGLLRICVDLMTFLLDCVPLKEFCE